jgi:hypothetical protein
LAFRANTPISAKELPNGASLMYALVALGLAVGMMALLNLIEFKRLD